MSTRTVVLVIAGAVLLAGALAFGIVKIFGPHAAPASAAVQVTGTLPASGYAHGILRNMVVSGSGFTQNARVSLERADTPALPGDGFALSGDTLSGGIVLDTDITGPWDVVVTLPDGSRGVCAHCFTIQPEAPSPTISDVSPRTFMQGAKGELLVQGTGFEPGATVAISGDGIVVGDTAVSSTAIRAQITFASGASLTPRTVTVTNADLKIARCADCLQLSAGPPSATALAPSTLGAGAKDRTVSVSGQGFKPGARVSFSGTGITATSTAVDEHGALTTRLALASSTEPGPHDLTVINPDGQKATCSGCLFVAASPRATAFAPASAAPGAQLDALISGNGFQHGMTVGFSGAGITTTAVAVLGDTQATVHLMLATSTTPGGRMLMLENPDGGASSVSGLFAVSSATGTSTTTSTSSTTTSTSP